MADRDPSNDTTVVEELRQRIAGWRETRTHRGAPMPAALWARAVRLARRHGVGPTARALRVDHGTLKMHVAAAIGDAAVDPPTFVEVAAPAPTGRAPSVIVVEGVHGRRLRLEVCDLTVTDLLAVLHEAWDGAR